MHQRLLLSLSDTQIQQGIAVGWGQRCVSGPTGICGNSRPFRNSLDWGRLPVATLMSGVSLILSGLARLPGRHRTMFRFPMTLEVSTSNLGITIDQFAHHARQDKDFLQSAMAHNPVLERTFHESRRIYLWRCGHSMWLTAISIVTAQSNTAFWIFWPRPRGHSAGVHHLPVVALRPGLAGCAVMGIVNLLGRRACSLPPSDRNSPPLSGGWFSGNGIPRHLLLATGTGLGPAHLCRGTSWCITCLQTGIFALLPGAAFSLSNAGAIRICSRPRVVRIDV